MDRTGHSIFGIDLGSTYSVVGYIDETGRAAVTRNSAGDDTTPSVVWFESDGNVVVGQAARETTGVNPDQVVSLIKREMGSGSWRREFFGTEYTPSAISAIILDALVKDAEADTGLKITDVVITVPAYFGLMEKDATMQAGVIAGLNAIGVVPEPIAAAVHYGVRGNADGTIALVYDLGGATFDVTLIRMTADSAEVLVVGGDHRLGGADWDAKLSDYLVDQIIQQNGNDSIYDDEAMLGELRTLAEKTKKDLSAAETRSLIVRYAGTPAKITVTRGQFEQMTADLLDSTIRITTQTLAEAERMYPGIKAQISEVLLVGGSSKMPAVAEALRREGWDPRLADPDLAVAKGAALLAAGATIISVPVPDSDVAPVAEQTGIDAGLVGSLGSVRDVIEVVAAGSVMAAFIKELVVKAADDVYSTLKRLKIHGHNTTSQTSESDRMILVDNSARVMLELPAFMDDADQESLSRLLRGVINGSSIAEERWLRISHSGESASWTVSLTDRFTQGDAIFDTPSPVTPDKDRGPSADSLLSDAYRRIGDLEKERSLLRGMVKYLASEIELGE